MEKEIRGQLFEIPRHVAIIMDGNGRWAKRRGMPRNVGHAKGSERVEELLPIAHDFGIEYVTVYAFSTENWKRSTEEVSSLMKLLDKYLKDSIKKATKNNMIVRVIGDRSALDERIIEKISRLEQVSKDNTGLNFTIAINYGSRDEMVRGIRKMAAHMLSNEIDPDCIDEQTLCSYLDTKDLPDPDLLIRTGGELRLSNFLMWQMAYTELYFSDVYWPDFTEDELVKAIEYYNRRDRRFGGLNN